MSALYNPGLLGADELVRLFVARRAELERLVQELHAPRPAHQLIVGARGMGKTTLLRRLAVEIDREPTLSSRWMALSFPEEQYNVGRLSDLWLNCLDALADALERRGDRRASEEIDAFIQGLPADEEVRAGRALERLLSSTRGGQGLVLLIDNVDQLFGRLAQHQWALRELLSSDERLIFVGASAAAMDAAFEYKGAFYDFFQVIWLRGLDLRATEEVIVRLAESAADTAVPDRLRRFPGRLRSLHVLTGGNPRTVVMLYAVLAREPDADVRRQLEALLDQATPLYKARFEALADQAQLVLDTLATEWDPRTAAEVAERARLEVNAVSTQLHRLHQEGVVEKVELPTGSRQGFQVAERFFNVWYLMRASRRLRQRLLSLARCLEALYGIEDLQALAGQVLKEGREADFTLIVAGITADLGLKRALQMKALDGVLCQPEQWAELRAALGSEYGEVVSLADRRERVAAALAIPVDWAKLGIEEEIGRVALAQAAGHEDVSVQGLVLVLGRHPAVDTDQAMQPAVLRVRSIFETFTSQLHTLRRLTGPRLWATLRRATLAGDVGDDLALPDLLGVAVRDGDLEFATWARLNEMVLGRMPFDPGIERAARTSRERSNALLWDLALGREARARAETIVQREPTTAGEYELRAVALMERGENSESQRDALAAWQLGARGMMAAMAALSVPAEHALATNILLAEGTPSELLRVYSKGFAQVFPEFALRAWSMVSAESDPLEPLEDLIQLCRGLILAGRAPDALALVDTDALRDRALPLYAALRAVVAGDADQLGQFAPEVALPAGEILDAIWPKAERPAGSPKKRKSRRG